MLVVNRIFVVKMSVSLSSSSFSLWIPELLCIADSIVLAECYCCVVSIHSLLVIFFCSFVVSTESMPPIITFLAPHFNSRNFHQVVLCPLFRLTAHDEIYTFAFTFLRVLQTESNLFMYSNRRCSDRQWLNCIITSRK